jgi:hypothetical protein
MLAGERSGLPTRIAATESVSCDAIMAASFAIRQSKTNPGGLWRFGTAHQNKGRKNGQLFFGQIRTLELRNSARFARSP